MISSSTSFFSLSLFTFFIANHNNGTGQLQASISIGVESSCCTLNPGTGLEVNRIQGDWLGVGEEGVSVYLPHGTSHSIWPSGSTHKPAILGQSIVDALSRADGSCFVKIMVLWVAGLENRAHKSIRNVVKFQLFINELLVSFSGKQHGTHRHTNYRVSIGWVGPVSGFRCVIIHEQGHHLRDCREGNICYTVHLLNVHNGLVHLARRKTSSAALAHVKC